MARSDTLPQPTWTTSKQRSGSQPYTRSVFSEPLYKQPPSGLNNILLQKRQRIQLRVKLKKQTHPDWKTDNHLTTPVSPSDEPIMLNFSRSHSLTVLQQIYKIQKVPEVTNLDKSSTEHIQFKPHYEYTDTNTSFTQTHTKTFSTDLHSQRRAGTHWGGIAQHWLLMYVMWIQWSSCLLWDPTAR